MLIRLLIMLRLLLGKTEYFKDGGLFRKAKKISNSQNFDDYEV